MVKAYHEQYCEFAANIAKKSMMQHQHGCVIVRGKQVIAEGINESFEHFNHQFSMHAEVNALNKIKQKDKRFLSQCTMYIVRIGPPSKSGMYKMSKPCLNCMKSIMDMGIGRVYYSTNECDEYDRASESPFYVPRTRERTLTSIQSMQQHLTNIHGP